MIPIPAELTVTGLQPRVRKTIRPQPAELTLTGLAPTLAAGTVALIRPAPATLRVTGRAPRPLVYNNAGASFARFRVRPAVEGLMEVLSG
jgi:hypothetical protein